jgi:hypothetical protein
MNDVAQREYHFTSFIKYCSLKELENMFLLPLLRRHMNDAAH